MTPVDVVTPSGQKLRVLGQLEKDFYEAQAKQYLDENDFTNASDLLDLDRLLFYELIVYRMTWWLGAGVDYDNFTIDRTQCQRNLKETSEQLSKVKTDLGLTKSARDKAQAESVGAYLTELKQRAKEFGVHREKQLVKGITLCHQLFSIVGAFDRADAVERTKIGFESEADVLDWVRNTMKPEFQAVDDHFAKNVQRYWTDL
jgi:hypothetical protein